LGRGSFGREGSDDFWARKQKQSLKGGKKGSAVVYGKEGRHSLLPGTPREGAGRGRTTNIPSPSEKEKGDV